MVFSSNNSKTEKKTKTCEQRVCGDDREVQDEGFTRKIVMGMKAGVGLKGGQKNQSAMSEVRKKGKTRATDHQTEGDSSGDCQ